MEIYKFEPYLKPVIWGGEKIPLYKNIATDADNIGESWEISGVAGHESLVADGTEKGLTLPQLIDKFKADLVGEKVYSRFGSSFPLLIKIIDAKRDLSVQVHPDDALAGKRHNCPGKSEMWYILDTEKGAKIYAGLCKQIDKDDYVELVNSNKIMSVVATFDSQPGDLYYLPAGRIHAIGAGNLLAEIQQTSDITYRIYDYDRRDANGKPRELHTEMAKDAIDYNVYPDYLGSYDHQHKGCTELVDCEHFNVAKAVVEGELALPASRDSFTIVVCIDGECIIETEGLDVNTRLISSFETLLVPAKATSIVCKGNATLLVARL